MKISKQATRAHLIVGGILVFLSLCSLIADFVFQLRALSFLIYFFGVWGGRFLARRRRLSRRLPMVPIQNAGTVGWLASVHELPSWLKR